MPTLTTFYPAHPLSISDALQSILNAGFKNRKAQLGFRGILRRKNLIKKTCTEQLLQGEEKVEDVGSQRHENKCLQLQSCIG